MKKSSNFFEALSARVTKVAGSPYAALTAVIIVCIWGVTGPLFHFSDTWQLVINTGTTIITFLMVFVIQQTQNKDTLALHLKLNELIACNEFASNRLVDLESLSEEELMTIKKFYARLAILAQREDDIHKSHSLDDACEVHQAKKETRKI